MDSCAFFCCKTKTKKKIIYIKGHTLVLSALSTQHHDQLAPPFFVLLWTFPLFNITWCGKNLLPSWSVQNHRVSSSLPSQIETHTGREGPRGTGHTGSLELSTIFCIWHWSTLILSIFSFQNPETWWLLKQNDVSEECDTECYSDLSGCCTESQELAWRTTAFCKEALAQKSSLHISADDAGGPFPLLAPA